MEGKAGKIKPGRKIDLDKSYGNSLKKKQFKKEPVQKEVKADIWNEKNK